MSKGWITFDLDGTLMQNPFIEWVFPEIEKIVNEKTKLNINTKEQLILEHENLMKKGLIVEAYDWDEIVISVLKKNDININIDVEELVIKHSIHPKVYLLEDDILNVLDNLKGKGYKLAIITNGYYKYQFPVIQKLGLTSFFELIITPERVGYAKPNINMIKASMNEKICAHIGDRIDHDIQFSNELGIASVLVHRKMSQSLSDTDLYKRSSTTEGLRYCQEKLKKETKNKKDEFKNEHIPMIMINSIHELKSIL